MQNIKKEIVDLTEIINTLRTIDITSLSDGSEFRISMNHLIKPKINKCKIVGPAITLKLPKGDSLLVQKALNIAAPGDILVIDSGNSYENAVWGDLRSLEAKTKKLEGVVIDGSIRDIKGCREINFPIFSKHIVCASSTKLGGGEINVPIICGDININPGDFIVGDENGVISIPKDLVFSIIKNAQEKERKVEESRKATLNNL